MPEESISEWLEGQPKWLKIAARRLLTGEAITEEDIANLTESCQQEAEGSLGEVECPSIQGVFHVATAGELRLKSIGDVKGINLLAPRTPLDFGETNLTVVYGANGSGKSGYVRILKHACGARRPGELLPDVHKSAPPKQECVISYELGDHVERPWEVDSGPISDLRPVDIFDAACGSLYVDEENEVTYEPPELAFFSEMVGICICVSVNLTNRKASFPSKKPTLPPEFTDTASGRWYAALSATTSDGDIAKSCRWGDADQVQLSEFENRISEQDPAEKARQLRVKKGIIDDFLKETKALLEKLSDEAYSDVISLRHQSVSAKELAHIAAEQAFADSPLPGVGSEAWTLLWNYAGAYSAERAYVGIPFPNLDMDARCPLCQQPLSDDAKDRLRRFEAFVKHQASRNAEEASASLNHALEALPEIASEEKIRERLELADFTEPEELMTLYSALRARKDHFAKTDTMEPLDALPGWDHSKSSLQNLAKHFDEDASKYERDALEGDRAKIIEQRREYACRKWLFEQLQSIEDERGRLLRVSKLDSAKELTDTTALSRKKGELAEELISEAFASRFKGELARLRADAIGVELVKTKVEKGRVLHRLRLTGVDAWSPDLIMSEGEHRVVCLAAFLADVGEKEFPAPFVFDDPISSLDQDYEEAVVGRLVELSAERQVIVFTHRLSLLALLDHYTKGSVHVVCVKRETWGTGEPGRLPIHLKPKNTLNELLDHRLPEAKKALASQGTDNYYPYAKALCSDFRILLEAIVEKILLRDIIGRFRKDVKTRNNLHMLAHITEEDCTYLDSLMSKYSNYEHSQPDEAPVPLPNPKELEQDLVGLKDWIAEFEKRPDASSEPRPGRIGPYDVSMGS